MLDYFASYAPEPNPGPNQNSESASTSVRYQCGECSITVGWDDRGVECETCGLWFHAHCQGIGAETYEGLNNSQVHWYCSNCGCPNSVTVFDLHGTESETWTTLLDPSAESETSCSTPTEVKFQPEHTSTPTRANQQNKRLKRPLRVININFRSVTGKKAELSHLLDSVKPDILIGTETHLDSDIKDSEIIDKKHGYRVYRKDRVRGGGGVLILVKETLNSMENPEFETTCEALWVTVKIKGRRSLYICAYYRPDNKDKTSILQWQIAVERVSSIPNAIILIGGDLNFPGWDWAKMTMKPKTQNSETHHKLIEIIQENGLQQMVTFPTREANTLDLIITNTPQLISRVEPLPRISDHEVVYAELNIETQRKKQVERNIRLYNKADWEKLQKSASETAKELDNMKDTASTEELWKHFKTKLNNAVEAYIPQKQSRPNTRQPWITPELRHLTNKRDRAYKKWRKSGSETHRAEARTCRREAQRHTRRAFWDYISSTLSDGEVPTEHIRPKYKRFWAYIKNQKSSNSGVAPLKANGRLVTDAKGKAELLDHQFQTAFSEGKQYSRDEYEEKCGTQEGNFPVLDDLEVTEEGVHKLLKNLKPNKASGPDEISSRILKELSTELAPALTTIFRSSLSAGQVPSDWRDALVSPIFKKGEHYNPANYRPVSLTCIVCKLLEHIVVHSLMEHLETNEILCHQQHGFRKNRSCEAQLLELVEELTSNMVDGLQTDMVILDFAKAFDKVNHSLLLHKIHDYGIKGKTNKWIKSFLSNRRQAVVVDGEKAEFSSVKSGVPQGSVLGPCLFLVYINDLPKNLNSKVRIFADDTAIYSTITADADIKQLQNDLQNLEVWENKWDMAFHPDKCTTLPVSRKENPILNEYNLHGHTLATVQSAKYLGVTLQANMEWNKHVDNIVAKAGRTLGFLRRNLKIASTTLREKAYLVFVRPLLEYACSVWDPYLEGEIKQIEAIQRRAARFVTNRYHRTASVTQMLERLGWPSLQQRRQAARLATMYKIHHNLARVDKTKLEQLPERRCRGHDQHFQRIPTQGANRFRHFSFLPRTIREWDQLPQDTVAVETVDAFRSKTIPYLKDNVLDALARGLQQKRY
ncbi:hypothetical protein ACOMHN_000227 [Nucella lapillus]